MASQNHSASWRPYNSPSPSISDLKEGNYALCEIEGKIYLIQVIYDTKTCIKIKFLESPPSDLKEMWVPRFQPSFNLIEILDKEHIRNFKIESIT